MTHRVRPIRRTLLILLCMILAVSLLPMQAFAGVSDEERAGAEDKTVEELKELMNSAKVDLDRCTAEYEDAQAALKKATDAAPVMSSKVNSAKETMDAAEWVLDQKSREAADQIVIDTWETNDKNYFNKTTPVARYAVDVYKDKGMTYENAWQYYLSGFRVQECRNSSSLNRIITDFENKYGSGTFDEVVTRTLGYNELMTALDHIDTCNRIRGDKAELASYWVKVKGESVPEDVKQLRISPSMMINSAISAALNSSRPDNISHIYKRAGIGMQGCAQNAHSNDTYKIKDAFNHLWYGENSRKQAAHNGNIAWPTYDVTGAALSNPNPYTGRSVFNQDFNDLEDPRFKTYTTEEYRNMIHSYCAREWSLYMKEKNGYDKARDAYAAAYQTYLDAGKTCEEKRLLKIDAEAHYKFYKSTYQSRSVKYLISFVDSLNGKIIKKEEVYVGTSATPPQPPVHSGYTFWGWDSSDYKNVKRSTRIYALYDKAGSNQSDPGAPGKSSIPQEITGKTPAALSDVAALIKGTQSDGNLKGSTHYQLRAKGIARSKTSITLRWKQLAKADYYLVYGNRCGKNNKYEKIRKTTGNVYTKKNLKKGKYYKFLVIAVRDGKVIAVSRTIHVATKGGKVGNHKKITITSGENAISLQAGDTYKMKVKAIPQSKNHKVRKHRAVKYESSNKRVASVGSKGIIKGKSKGSCYIYAYAQNGVWTRIKVTVKNVSY